MARKQNQVAEIITDIKPSNEIRTVKKNNYDEQVLCLSDADKERCLSLTSKIDINDSTSIRMYGADLSNTISRDGDKLMSMVSTSTATEAIDLTNDLFKQLKMVDVDELNDTKVKRFLRRIPIIKKLVSSVSNLFEKYDSIKTKVDKIQNKFVQIKLVAQRDNSTLEEIFNTHVEYINSLRELIVAAKYKRQEIAAEVDAMTKDPNTETYQINDANIFLNNLDKRIADMITEEAILEQDLFKIRIEQHNNIGIQDQADNVTTHIIPLWKSQIAQSVIMNNSQTAASANSMMRDYTNQMLQKNAEVMKTVSIEVAKNSEAPMITSETMNNVTKSIIDTMTELKNIRENGKQLRENHIEACLGSSNQIMEMTKQLAESLNK